MSGDDCIDEVLSAVGCGWWLGPIFMATAIANVITVQEAATPFITAPLPFRCSSPDDLPRLAYTVLADSTTNTSTNNTSNSTTITEVDSTPWYNSKCLDTTSSSTHTLTVDFISLSSSSVDPGRHSTGLLSCPVIEYDRSLFISSIFSEFHLVCERTSLRPRYQQMFATGGILGSWIVGPLADLLGRKRGILVGGLLGLPACLGVALAPWYPVVMLLRLVAGGCSRMIIISFTVLYMSWMRWVFVMAAYCLGSGAYQTIAMYTSELFSTSIRVRGTAVCVSMAGVGCVIVPVVTDVLAQKVWWSLGVTIAGSGFLLS